MTNVLDGQELGKTSYRPRRFWLALVVTGCLCALLATLLIQAGVRNSRLNECIRSLNGIRSFEQRHLTWQVMTSYGLTGKKIKVQVGDSKCVEFMGTPERESFANLLGPAHAAALPATGKSERVVVTVDGSIIFDQGLAASGGPLLVIQHHERRGYSVQQAKMLLYY